MGIFNVRRTLVFGTIGLILVCARPALAQSLQQSCNPVAQAYGRSVCTATELVLYAKDTTGTCLKCMMTNDCLDNPDDSVVGEECGDIASSSACLETLQCTEGVLAETTPPVLVTPPMTLTGQADAPLCGENGRSRRLDPWRARCRRPHRELAPKEWNLARAAQLLRLKTY